MIKRVSSLPLQLIFFIILPLLALLVLVAFGGVAIHRAEMRDMIAEHNLDAVRGTAASLSHRLEQRRAVLAGLAREVDGGREAAQVVEGAHLWASELFDGGVAVYSAEGDLLAASPGFPAEFGVPGHGMSMLPAGDGQPARIAITAEAGGEGPALAAGIASLESLGIHEALESLHVSEYAGVWIVTQAGEVVYHNSAGLTDAGVSVQPHGTAALAGEGGAEILTRDDGEEIVVTSAAIPATGWVLVHEEQWQAALSPLMRFSLAAPLILIPGVFITAGALWFGLQQVVRPLQRLERRAADMAWGDHAAAGEPVGGIAEIRRLQETLRHLAERIQATQAATHNYIGVITQAQEDERARLARELHDETAQSLIAISHRQQTLKRHFEDDPDAEKLLAELREMTVQALDDLRRIIRAMRPTYLDELGLVPALQMLAKDVGATAPSATVEFVLEGEPSRLPPEHEMALYRVAQEALNNAWQHSGAGQITLEVRFTAPSVTVTVRDNGRGFEAPRRVTDLSEHGHFGLMGMYERAALIGAELRIQSQRGEGTTVTVRTAPV